RLQMETTGNAGGVHNLTIDPGDQTLEEMIKSVEKGFLATEFIGTGINSVTGDYSRGAAGFWVENGQIAYPVNECTIAGNLRDMLMRMEAANDALPGRGAVVPSLRVEGMTVAGA
ncbi:MAG: metallopeptidase TldD-related protein, partial [Paracoccus sp. (in: a-proteobacteria)]